MTSLYVPDSEDECEEHTLSLSELRLKDILLRRLEKNGSFAPQLTVSRFGKIIDTV